MALNLTGDDRAEAAMPWWVRATDRLGVPAAWSTSGFMVVEWN